MTRAVAPMLAAMRGRTSTTRHAASPISSSGSFESHFLDALEVQLAAAQKRQFRDAIKIALARDPQVRQAPAQQLRPELVNVEPVQVQVQHHQPLALAL